MCGTGRLVGIFRQFGWIGSMMMRVPDRVLVKLSHAIGMFVNIKKVSYQHS